MITSLSSFFYNALLNHWGYDFMINLLEAILIFIGLLFWDSFWDYGKMLSWLFCTVCEFNIWDSTILRDGCIEDYLLLRGATELSMSDSFILMETLVLMPDFSGCII